MRLLLALSLGLLPLLSVAQDTIPKLEPAELLSKGKKLYDNEEYEKAIALYKIIPPNDSAYPTALYQTAVSYYAMNKFDSVVAVSRRGLEYSDIHAVDFYSAIGNALDDTGRVEEAIEAYKEGIERYPHHYELYYNLGLTYFRKKDYPAAQEYLIKALERHPYHGSSHYLLGAMATMQEHYTHAFMAYSTYLLIFNSGSTPSTALSILESIADGTIKKDDFIKPFTPNAFEDQDALIISKVAMNPKYKVPVPVQAAIVKQLNLLFEKFEYKENSDDFYMKNYGPLFSKIREHDMVETLIWSVLLPAREKIEDIAKWESKNSDDLSALYRVANVELGRIRSSRMVTTDNISSPLPVHYENNILRGVGEVVDNNYNKSKGPWTYFHETHAIQAAGSFNDQFKKTGTWKYYDEEGRLQKLETYNDGKLNGPYRLFFPDGTISLDATYKNDSADGRVKIYHNCGSVEEDFSYRNGKREGEAVEYYFWGPEYARYSYKDGSVEGPVRIFYPDGKVQQEYSLKAGNRVGDYKSYHMNGKPGLAYSYNQNGVQQGSFVNYYENGQIQRSGNILDGEEHGEWKYYDEDGTLNALKNYDKGALVEEHYYHPNGKVHMHFTYSKGKTTYYAYSDSLGNPSIAQKVGKSTKLQGIFPDGKKRVEGHYNKGKEHGVWKWYYSYGPLSSEKTYVDGSATGPMIKYFENGQPREKAILKDNMYHGYYTSYYQNGQKAAEGWMKNDDRDGKWVMYHPHGTVSQVVYYRDGTLNGPRIHYTTTGQIDYYTLFRDGKVEFDGYADSTGNIISDTTRNSGFSFISVSNFPGGAKRVVSKVECGSYHGPVNWFYPDGSKDSEFNMVNGVRQGKYTGYHRNGKIASTGNYINGDRDGKWEYYNDEGRLTSESHYDLDEKTGQWIWYHSNGSKKAVVNYINDLRQGWASYYAPDGSLMYEKLYHENVIQAYRYQKPDGSLTEAIPLRDASGKVEAYYSNGQLSHTSTYKYNDLQGTYTRYFPNGKLMEEEEYKDANREGRSRTWYENGNPETDGTYYYDNLNGVYTEYREDGTPKRSYTYIHGEIHGEVTTYDAAGNKIKTDIYWNGFDYDGK